MNRFPLVLALVFALLAAGSLAAAPFEVVTIDSLRFEAGLASQAVAPTPYLAIPFGAGPDQVGGADQDAKRLTDGVPNAFFPTADGSVWVLDAVNQTLKRFSPDGKPMAQVSVAALTPKDNLVCRDVAPGPGDGFYVQVPQEGKVLRIDGTGKVAVEIEGVNDARAIGADPKGNVLIDVPAMNALLRFNPAGEIIEQYAATETELGELSVYTDLEGRPYFVKGTDKVIELGRLTQASPTQEVVLASFPLDVPADRGARFVSGKVLGVDASWNVYLEMVACDDDGVIHRHRVCRLAPDGKVLAQADIRVIPYLSPELPRHVTVMPDGRLLGFHVDGDKWHLSTWSLGK